MKTVWMHKQENANQLILFFCGWGGDEKAFMHLKSDGSNVLLLYDYRSLNLDDQLLAEIKKYQSIKIIAWSFGVWMAAYMVQKYELDIEDAVAINGTLFPVDDEKGIPEKIAKATLEYLTEASIFKFQRRMVGSENWKKYQELAPYRDFEDLKEGLSALYNYFKNEGVVDIYTKVIIGKEDMIFPYRNQKNAWKEKEDLVEIEGYHFCFFDCDNWNHLLNAKSELCYG